MRDLPVSSSYWFLINSNCSIHNPHPDSILKLKNFREYINRVFLSRNILNFINITNPDDKNIPKEQLFTELKSEVILEVGDNNNFLHAHITITVYHRTSIRLAIDKLSKFFSHNYHSVIYISPPKIIPDNSVLIKRYQYKALKKFPLLKIDSTITDELGVSKNYFFKY